MLNTNFLKTITLVFVCIFCSNSWSQSKGMVIHNSAHSVDRTEKRLLKILQNKGFRIFSQINHSEGAKAHGIDLPATRVVIFGKPQVGSKLMQCSPSVAIDLPQKMLIWKEDQQVKLAYNSPRFLQKRHQMKNCETLLKKINDALNKIAEKATSNGI